MSSYYRYEDKSYPTTYSSSYRSYASPLNKYLDSNQNKSTVSSSNLKSSSQLPSRSSSLNTSYIPARPPPYGTTASLRTSGAGSSYVSRGAATSSGLSSRDYDHIFSQIARIQDHLYLCSLNAITLERLRSMGITLVVTAMNEPPPLRYVSDISTVHVPVEDIDYANIRPHFDRVADRIHAEQRRGGKALVHCAAGISRSTSLILAYLMKYQGMSLRQAFEHTRARRPYVFPNMGFWRQLIDYEQHIRKGQSSVKMVTTDRGVIPDLVADILNATITGPTGFSSVMPDSLRTPSFRANYASRF